MGKASSIWGRRRIFPKDIMPCFTHTYVRGVLVSTTQATISRVFLMACLCADSPDLVIYSLIQCSRDLLTLPCAQATLIIVLYRRPPSLCKRRVDGVHGDALPTSTNLPHPNHKFFQPRPTRSFFKLPTLSHRRSVNLDRGWFVNSSRYQRDLSASLRFRVCGNAETRPERAER